VLYASLVSAWMGERVFGRVNRLGAELGTQVSTQPEPSLCG